ncbi:hypothetical protein [Nonomuraea sp. LPB2021202275-12-8]|uniref:hypothetical protein n=1 Tax=Nonomuraea sp. LPB2021202275-12-8 TaxID=3120159 RepID=UPI00300C4000
MHIDETTNEIRQTGEALKEVAANIRTTTADNDPEELAAGQALAVLLEQIAEHGGFVPVRVRAAAQEVAKTLPLIMA